MGKCIDQFGGRDRTVDADGEVRSVRGMLWRDGQCPVPSGKLDETIRRRGLDRRGKIGNAESTLVLAHDLWKIRREHLRRHCPRCKVRPRKRRRKR
jgi:hypothetical protein